MGTVNKRSIAIILFIMCLSLTACTASVKNSSPLVSTAEQIPSYPNEEYKIRAGDQLDIKFFYNPDLNEQVTVRPDGRISLQLVHEIVAAGLTPLQLTDLLTKRYAADLDNPEVTVIVRSFSGQTVFVDGEVNKPGMLNLLPPMTVLQSLSQAGGVKDTAKTSEVVVIRRLSENKFYVFAVNVNKVIDGTDMSQDPVLMPSDIVYVPRTVIANLDIFIDQYIRKMIPISTGLTYQINRFSP